MTEEIPPHHALRLQLALIVGAEPRSSFIEIRPLKPNGQPATRERSFIPVGDHDRTAARILALREQHNVFMGCAPRTRREGTADAIERVWCLWADCDDHGALERLQAFRPLPNLVVRSGSDDSAHGYWQLDKPLSPAWARRANLRLALALGADRAATDAARILRPAGTLNHKHDPPRPVVCTRLELDVHTFAAIVGGLPDDAAYTPRPPAASRLAPSPSRLLEGLVRTVGEADCGNRNRALFWAACRASEHGLDQVEAFEALREAGLAVGLAEFEIERTIRSGLETADRTAA